MAQKFTPSQIKKMTYEQTEALKKTGKHETGTKVRPETISEIRMSDKESPYPYISGSTNTAYKKEHEQYAEMDIPEDKPSTISKIVAGVKQVASKPIEEEKARYSEWKSEQEKNPRGRKDTSYGSYQREKKGVFTKKMKGESLSEGRTTGEAFVDWVKGYRGKKKD